MWTGRSQRHRKMVSTLLPPRYRDSNADLPTSQAPRPASRQEGRPASTRLGHISGDRGIANGHTYSQTIRYRLIESRRLSSDLSPLCSLGQERGKAGGKCLWGFDFGASNHLMANEEDTAGIGEAGHCTTFWRRHGVGSRCRCPRVANRPALGSARVDRIFPYG